MSTDQSDVQKEKKKSEKRSLPKLYKISGKLMSEEEMIK